MISNATFQEKEWRRIVLGRILEYLNDACKLNVLGGFIVVVFYKNDR